MNRPKPVPQSEARTESKTGPGSKTSPGGKANPDGKNGATSHSGAVAKPGKTRKTTPTPARRSSRWLQIGLILLAGGLVTAAWIYYEEADLRKAFQYEAARQPENAIRWVNLFLQTHPDNTRALALKARLLAAAPFAEGPPEAIEIFDRIGPASTDDMHAWGVAYMRTEQWSRALPWLKSVLEAQPEDPFALYEVTICHIRLGLLRESLETAVRYTEVPGYRAKGLVLQAVILNDLHNPEPAVEAYSQALEVSPDATDLQIAPGEFFTQYGTLLASLGRAEEAVAMLERSIKTTPYAYAYVNLGNAYDLAGDKDRAVAAWKRALQIDKNSGDARQALASASLAEGKPQEGLEWLQGMAERPDLQSSTAYLFQQLYYMSGDEDNGATWRDRVEKLREVEERRQIIEQFLVRSPRSYWATVIRAHRYATTQNWRQAEDLLAEIRQIDTTDPFVSDLVTAIESRGPLPSVERIPVKHF